MIVDFAFTSTFKNSDYFCLNAKVKRRLLNNLKETPKLRVIKQYCEWGSKNICSSNKKCDEVLLSQSHDFCFLES